MVRTVGDADRDRFDAGAASTVRAVRNPSDGVEGCHHPLFDVSLSPGPGYPGGTRKGAPGRKSVNRSVPLT